MFLPLLAILCCVILCCVCVCFVIVFQLLNLLSLFFKLIEYQKIKLSLQIHSFYIELTDEFDNFDHMVFGNYPLDMLYFSLQVIYCTKKSVLMFVLQPSISCLAIFQICISITLQRYKIDTSTSYTVIVDWQYIKHF